MSSQNGNRPTNIFGVDVETGPPADLLRRILGYAERAEHRRVAYVNAHVLNQSSSDPALRAALQRSDLVYCDGYGVRLAAKAIGLEVPHRMTGADWIWGVASLCQATRRSLYLLGSDPGAAREAAACLRRWYPRLDVRGTHHGYFEIGTPHSERVIEDIAAHKPDVLLVGMGTPLQELWVDHYFDRLEAHVVWTVGALFDYVSGRVRRAPHWLSDNGLEWIFRLAIEPRRMWRRYLLGNPVFLWRVWQERSGAALPLPAPAANGTVSIDLDGYEPEPLPLPAPRVRGAHEGVLARLEPAPRRGERPRARPPSGS
jgi:N-acetylglucosaminyldiphosphoundecaprenol N-acetyl-beta-D-mannosaminyltransferase